MHSLPSGDGSLPVKGKNDEAGGLLPPARQLPFAYEILQPFVISLGIIFQNQITRMA